MAICPHCKEQIQDGAKKCHQCGSWVTKPRRIFGSVKSTVEFLTFIAAVFVLGVMIYQYTIMKETIKQGWENIDLFRASVERMDTSIAIARREFKLAENDFDLKLKQFKADVEQSVFERKIKIDADRPNISISAGEITVTDTVTFIRIKLINKGNSDAENMKVSIFCKFPDQQKDFSYHEITKISKKGGEQTFIEFTDKILNDDFWILVVITYDWPSFGLNFPDYKGYRYDYDMKKRNFTPYNLDKNQIIEIFK